MLKHNLRFYRCPLVLTRRLPLHAMRESLAARALIDNHDADRLTSFFVVFDLIFHRLCKRSRDAAAAAGTYRWLVWLVLAHVDGRGGDKQG